MQNPAASDRSAGVKALLPPFAALMGAAGVTLAAVSAHGGGGGLAETGALFLILHAAALLGISAHARLETTVTQAGALIAAGYGLGLGAVLFSADLAMRSLEGTRLFPFAAPIGGSAMILAWFALFVIFALAAFRRGGSG
jgi:uncharacterized membrane protein YgdD (TMEM256/DUF423 family)